MNKNKLWIILCVLIILAICMFGCASYKQDLIASPNNVVNVWKGTQKDSYSQFVDSVQLFSSNFNQQYYKNNNDSNFVISPLSLYMALSLAAESSNESSRQEILEVMGVSYEELIQNISTLYEASSIEIKDDLNKVSCKEQLTNSIWIDKKYKFNNDTINSLVDNYYCYPFSVNFTDSKTNKKIQKFIKDNTNKLLNPECNFSEDTAFLIMNTLYFKDTWNLYGKNLNMTSETYSFKNEDGTTKGTALLEGEYHRGKIYETEEFMACYTMTNHNYYIYFIIPKGANKLSNIFENDNLYSVLSHNYNEECTENLIYKTKCLFPEFSVETNSSIVGELKNLGITSMFDSNKDSFSNLIYGEKSWCSDVLQINKLNVNKKGIEGASATIMPGCGAAGPIETIYQTLTVDRAFGFVITDSKKVPIFSGMINNL